MCRYLVCMMTIGLSLSTQMWSQQEDDKQPISYDVVSIRSVQGSRDDMSFHEESDGFVAKNVGVEQLLSRAYLLRSDLISGVPGPLQKETFDITAKITASDSSTLPRMTDAQQSRALMEVLNTRFNLKAHTETKLRPGFDLFLIRDSQSFIRAATTNNARSGVKKVVGIQSGALSRSTPEGTTTRFAKVSMDGLAVFISAALNRTTLNRTGVPGSFDFTITWLPPDRLLEEHPEIIADSPLATALKHQLALGLRAVTVPTPTLIVDEMTEPTPN